jgi:hypothetical protein
MEDYQNGKTEEPGDQPDDQSDFIRKFIEQKKLQNRVLGEILEKINKAERSNKSQTINKNKKS